MSLWSLCCREEGPLGTESGDHHPENTHQLLFGQLWEGGVPSTQPCLSRMTQNDSLPRVSRTLGLFPADGALGVPRELMGFRRSVHEHRRKPESWYYMSWWQVCATTRAPGDGGQASGPGHAESEGSLSGSEEILYDGGNIAEGSVF